MVELIQLKISSPSVKLPGLEDAIKNLGTLDALLDRIGKRAPINIQGFTQASGAIKGMSDSAKILVDNLERAGQSGAAGAMRTGFKSAEEELERLNIMAANLQRTLRAAPSGAMLANPAIANQVDALQSALASVNLRRHEIQSAKSDVTTRAQFDREADVLAAAEQTTTASAVESTGALRAQNEVVLTKTGSMERLAGSAGKVAAAEGQSTRAMQENALISERYVTTKGKQELAESKFRTGIGETQRVMGEGGAVIIDQINYLEKFGAQFRQLDTEFAQRKSSFAPGSPDHVQLLRQEADANNALIGKMKEAGLAEESLAQRRATRAAALESRANTMQAKFGTQAVSLFEARSGQFTEPAETRRTTAPSGQVTERKSLSREAGGMREGIALTSQFDERGRLLNATLEETSRKIDNVGKTSQGSLIGTAAMAAKFILIYRGLDLAIQGLEAGAKATIEFERKLATLQIVFRGTKEEARDMALGVLNQAAALGQDGVAALDVATDFARFGLSQTEVLEAVRVAMVAANVAQLDLAQSGKYLQAIYAGYQLNIGQLAGVLGSLDTVSHSYNVTNTQLLEGLSRVAPLAKQAGISLNELIGFEAVISGRTARPGSEAGNAIKSLISRLAKPKTQADLQDIAGVSVINPVGNLKDASQIINELFVSYQNLGKAEQQELLIKLAGTMQASRVAALLDGYLKSQELAIMASRDLGRAERENIAVRQTLMSQLGTLKTEWEKFWVASANPGLAGGAQNNLTEIVKNLSNMLSVLSAAERLAAKMSGGQSTKPKTFGQGLTESLASGTWEALDPFAKIRGNNQQFENLKKFLESHGMQIFKTDADEATDSLIKFNAELDKLEKAGEADQGETRLIKTVERLIDTASPAKLDSYIRSVSRAATQPGDVRGGEAIRSELTALAKSGDFLQLHARLSEIAKNADRDRAQQMEVGNRKLDERIAKETLALKILNDQRSGAARGGNKSETDRLDTAIDLKEQQLAQLNTRRVRSLQNPYPEGDEDQQYALDRQAEKEARKAQLDDRFKGIEEVTGAYPKTSESHVDELNRKLDEVRAKAEETGRFADEQRQKAIEARAAILEQTTGDKSEEAAALRREAAEAEGAAFRTIREENDERQKALGLERDKLEALRAYAELQDAIVRGARTGRNEVQQYKIGRNTSEQEINEAGGIIRQLLPQSQQRFDTAGRAGDVKGQAAAQAEGLELANRLTNIQISLDERRFQLAAQIVNERRKEAEEASKALQTASREEQLRAALIARFVQNRGGRGFSANEFQFLDQHTKEAITKFNPNAAPPTLPSRSHEMEQELAGLNKVFGALTDVIQKTVSQIEKNIGRNLITNPNPAADKFSVPGGAMPQPTINIDAANQIAEVTRYLGDVVGARLDREIADIRVEVRNFIGSQRINSAQSAATSAA